MFNSINLTPINLTQRIELVDRNGYTFRVPVDNFCRYRFDTSPSKSKQVSTSFIPGQEKYMTKALDLYGASLGQGENVFQGERLAPLTPVQTQATDVQGFLDKFAPYRDMPMFGETGQALSGMLAGETGAAPITPEATEKYITGAIADPRRRAFEQYERPGYREEFAGPGFWGSGRADYVSGKRQEMEDWIGEMGTQTRWDVEQANRQIEEAKAGRALSAIQPAMEYAQLPTTEAREKLSGRQEVLGLASVQQQQEQAELNVVIQKFAEEYRLTNAEDMEILMALLGMSYSTSVGSSKGAGLGYAMLSGAAAGAGQGAGAAAMSALIASDERIKENIQPCKNALEIIRKLKTYFYNYIGQDGKTLGLMAQDVEKVLPEAVVEINGVKHIDKYAIQTLVVGAINELLGDKKCPVL